MLKVGKINYANVLPVYHELAEEELEGRIQLIAEVPAELNRKMSVGELDVGPISSFAYALNHERYFVLPDLSVSSKGKVRSIYLFSKKPLHELDGSSIALTSSSATSVALLKVILKSFIDIEVRYETMPPSFKNMLQHHDAALLIGDDAIRAKWEGKIPYVYDLGELWYDFTGKRMTYAVWVVQRKSSDQSANLITALHQAFMESKSKAAAHITPLIETVCRTHGGTASFWKEYFAGLSYDFTTEHIDGLESFYELCFQNGLLDSACKVALWQPNKVVFK